MTARETSDEPASHASTVAKVIAVTVLMFVLIEGLASVGYAAYGLLLGRDTFMAQERLHTEYDATLGWVHRANVYVPDMYGKGIYFRSNSQRLRANRDYAREVPAGKARLICSGDSFALGHSVSNDQAWCTLLETMFPGIETVNMGQAAYGVDQAFLWYRRDGGALRHNVHLFSFITSDFERMQFDNFGGYPKPYLSVRDGALVVENTPVPKRRTIFRSDRFQDAANELRIVKGGLLVLRLLGVRNDPKPKVGILTDDQAREVTAKIMEELKRLNAERGSTLVIVFLPKSGDSGNRSADRWRTFISEQTERLGIPFVDLVGEFRKLPVSEGESLFTRPYFPSHYNSRGNEWAAKLIHERLLQIPPIRGQVADSAAAGAP